MLTRREATGTLGQAPEDRPVEDVIEYGMLNVDKPAGPSSHQVSAWVKKMLGIDKAGHAGTLDPNVTGVLPVALGRATRITHGLLSAPKTYVGELELHGETSDADLKKVVSEYKGDISQVPPVRSAVKREERERTIYEFELLERDDRRVLFRVRCEAGTYIRKLCHDIGEDLKVGGHMRELRRTAVGPFTEDTTTRLQDLQEALHLWNERGDEEPLRDLLLPVEEGVSHLESVHVLDSAVKTLVHGASLKVPGISTLSESIQEGTLVAVKTLKGELVETGEAQLSSEEMVEHDSGVAVTPKQVFMRPSDIDGE